ncbi:hypothetical protein C3L33_18817, partial [Rhododendron williamsianum]
MESGPRDGYSITIPLLVDNHEKEQDKLCVKEAEGNTSFFKTCFNGLNALSGVGILSVPYALSSGGWLSLLLLFVIAAVTFYTGLLIKRCMDVDPHVRSYPDIGELAFGNKGRIVVSVFMNMELYLVATGFLILEGDNLQNLLPGWELRLLEYQLVENKCSIVWAGAHDGIGFEQKGTLLNWKGIPTAVSLYAFCYCAHPVFPTLYTSMENKKQFSKITLNLPTKTFSSKVAIYTTLVNPVAKYALMRHSFDYIPCLCYLKISGTYRRLGFEPIVIEFIVLLGIAIVIVGTYTSVLEILGHL